MREVLAGIAGYAIFVVCSVLLFMLGGYDPHREVSLQFQVTSICAGIVFALFAGYVTAALSPASPTRPVIVVSFLIGIVAILSLLTSGSAESWSQLAALLLMAPAVIVGGMLRRRQQAHRSHAQHGV
jgi:peptidoglycan/LPS O-acetylase OafA/YrhL